MTYAEQADVDLLDELGRAQLERVDELERRILALESRLGIASETHYGKRKLLLTAEGEREDPQELVVEDLGNWAGMPLARGFDGGRSAMLAEAATGFHSFSPGRPDADKLLAELFEPSSAPPGDDIKRRLGALLAEREPAATQAEPAELQPHEVRGMPLARGFC